MTYAYTDASGVYTSSIGLPSGTYYASTSMWSGSDQGYLDELYDNILCPGSAYFGFCTPASGTPITVIDGSTTPGIDFALASGGRISGTVTDVGTGLPLANVAVDVYNSSGYWFTYGYTNASGVYTSNAGLPSGTYYARTSNSLGYLDELYDNISCPGGACTVTTGTPISVTVPVTHAGIDFALAQGGRISGTVTSVSTGLPLANMTVNIYNSSGGWFTSGRTNISGVYTSNTGLPSGTYYARTSNSLGYVDELYDNIPCPGGQCTVTTGTPISVTAPTTTTGINFALAQGGRISGTVTSVATGLPLASVSVRIYSSSGSSRGSGFTNSGGVYTSHTGLPSGIYYARTSNSLGYVEELYDNISCPGAQCTVTTGTPISVTAPTTTTGINFALAQGGRISGTVTDAGTGLPLTNVAVDVYSSTGNWLTYGYANSSGAYTSASGLPTGTYYEVTWNAQGYVDELYNNIPCPGYACTVTSGTPVGVTAGLTTSPISFALGYDVIFKDGFQ